MKLMNYIACGLLAILPACNTAEKTGKGGIPTGPQTVERLVNNLETKDHIKVSFSAIMTWQYASQPATAVSSGEFAPPDAVETVYVAALTEDLPKLIGGYEFPKLMAVHDDKPAVAKLEEQMLEKLRSRAITATPGVNIDKFLIRRMDLTEATQRNAGFDEIERRRMREIWLAPQPGR